MTEDVQLDIERPGKGAARKVVIYGSGLVLGNPVQILVDGKVVFTFTVDNSGDASDELLFPHGEATFSKSFDIKGRNRVILKFIGGVGFTREPQPEPCVAKTVVAGHELELRYG